MAKPTRAGRAGRLLGAGIVEMINLMYQDNTAINFLKGLLPILRLDFDNRIVSRKLEKEEKRLKKVEADNG